MTEKEEFLLSQHVSSPSVSNAGTEGIGKILAAINEKVARTPIRYQGFSKVPLGQEDKPTA